MQHIDRIDHRRADLVWRLVAAGVGIAVAAAGIVGTRHANADTARGSDAPPLVATAAATRAAAAPALASRAAADGIVFAALHGGIHYRFDADAGFAIARAVADAVSRREGLAQQEGAGPIAHGDAAGSIAHGDAPAAADAREVGLLSRRAP